MGDLMGMMAAGGRVRTLNSLFDTTQFEATRRLIKILRVQYGPLLKGPGNAGEHKRRKRLRSLRYAASLLNEDLNFKAEGAATDPSGGKLRHWLRWLSWLETLQVGDATMSENSQPLPNPQPTPHELISRTIAAAIDDDDATSIVFRWNHDAATMKVDVSWDAGTPRVYRISVQSKRSSHADVNKPAFELDGDFDPEP